MSYLHFIPQAMPGEKVYMSCANSTSPDFLQGGRTYITCLPPRRTKPFHKGFTFKGNILLQEKHFFLQESTHTEKGDKNDNGGVAVARCSGTPLDN